jgi:WD40 repeat protein
MNGRVRALCVIVVAAGCAGNAPPRPAPAAPAASASASASASDAQTGAGALAQPAPVAVEPAADPYGTIALAYQERAAGREVDARRDFARALAGLERQLGAKVVVGMSGAAYTNPVQDNGSLIALGRDNQILVYDVRTWTPKLRIVGEDANAQADVTALALSPDSAHLVATFGGKSFSMWDVRTGKMVRTFEGHSKTIVALAFSGDGRTIVSGAEDATMRTWNADTGRSLRTVPLADGVSAMTVTPRGDAVVCAPYRGPIAVYSIAAGLRLKTIAPPKGQVMGLAFSGNGSALAVSVEDSPGAAIHLYDYPSGVHRRANALVAHGTLSHDGRLLAGSFETGLHVIDLARGATVFENKRYFRPHFLPDGLLQVLDAEGTVIVIDPRSGNGRTVVPTPRAATSIAFSLASRVVSRTRSGIELCDLAPRLDCRELGGQFRDVGYDAKGTTLAVLRDDDGSVDVYDARLQKKRNLLGRADTTIDTQNNTRLVLSRDGRRAAIGEYRIHLLDLDGGYEMKVPKMEAHGDLAMSPDGKRIAGPLGFAAAVYDTETGTRVAELGGHKGSVTALAFSEDGRLLATGAADKTIRVFDLANKTIAQSVAIDLGARGRVSSLAFSPDGRRLAASVGQTARIFDTDGLRPIATLTGHALPVFGVAYRSDGHVLASASTDGLVRLWSPEGKLIVALGFLEGDSAFALSADRDKVELYGNARTWLTCDVGPLSFPFDLCEERVVSPGMTGALTR